MIVCIRSKLSGIPNPEVSVSSIDSIYSDTTANVLLSSTYERTASSKKKVIATAFILYSNVDFNLNRCDIVITD